MDVADLKPKHGVPSEIVTVERAKSPAFFYAVLAAWARHEGRSKAHFRKAHAVAVPRAVVDDARDKLEKGPPGL